MTAVPAQGIGNFAYAAQSHRLIFFRSREFRKQPAMASR
jgi:hypothetical protein